MGKPGNEPNGGSRPRKRLKRLALVALGGFGALVLILVLTGDGDEDPSIPASAIMVITDSPNGTVEITKTEFDQEFRRVALASGLEPPQPDEPRYDEVKAMAIEGLLDPIWVIGQAEELGLGLSDKELSEEAQKAKDKEFDSEADFKVSLKKNHSTLAEFEESVEKQVLTRKVQKWVEDQAPEPSQEEIEDRLAEFRKFTEPEPEERTFRYVINKNRAEAEKALELVDVDYTYHPNWGKAARLYSEDQKTKSKGGLQTVREGDLPDALNDIVFSAESEEPPPEKVLKTPDGFVVFELQSITEAIEKPTLEEKGDELADELQPKVTNEFIGEFGTDYNERWRSRTFCAPGFVFKKCANSTVPLQKTKQGQ